MVGHGAIGMDMDLDQRQQRILYLSCSKNNYTEVPGTSISSSYLQSHIPLFNSAFLLNCKSLFYLTIFSTGAWDLSQRGRRRETATSHDPQPSP